MLPVLGELKDKKELIAKTSCAQPRYVRLLMQNYYVHLQNILAHLLMLWSDTTQGALHLFLIFSLQHPSWPICRRENWCLSRLKMYTVVSLGFELSSICLQSPCSLYYYILLLPHAVPMSEWK